MAADIILRFAIMGKDAASMEDTRLAVKALAVSPGDRVVEVQAKLRAKVEEQAAGLGPDTDYCLLLPGSEGSSGQWLEPQLTFADYMEGGTIAVRAEGGAKVVLKDKDTLEYRKTKRMLRVRTLDLTVRTLLVENAKMVVEVMDVICKRINIPNNNEFSLAFQRETGDKQELDKDERRIQDKMTKLRTNAKLVTEGEVNWLQHDQTLMEQGVMEEEVLVMKRKFYHGEETLTKQNPVQLRMFYEQAKQAILNGTHPVPLETAKKLAAFQIQAQWGDYIDGRKIDVKPCLPEDLKKSASSLKKELMAKHQELKGHSELDAIYEYVKLARSLNTFGVHFFLVREQQKGRNRLVPLLMGITKDSILRLDFETKMPQETFQLSQVTKHAATDKILKVNFAKSSFTVATAEGQKISDLIEGYAASLRERQRREEEEYNRKREHSSRLKREKDASKAPCYPESLKNKIFADIERATRLLTSSNPIGIIDDPKWKEDQTEKATQGLQAGAADVNHAMAQMIHLLGQGTKADLVELDRVMGGLSEQLHTMAGLAAMYNTLNQEDGNRVKDAVTDLCSNLDSMFKAVSDIFNKNELAIEPKTEFIFAAKKVGDSTSRVLETVHTEGADNPRKPRVDELAAAVATATASLGQAAKELTKGTAKEETAKVLGAALKVVHSTSRMVTSAKILSSTIEDPGCRDQLLMLVDDIALAVKNFQNETKGVAGGATKATTKSGENVLSTLDDLLEHLKTSTDNKLSVARDDIVTACDTVLRCQRAGEAIKAVRSCGEKVKVMINDLKEQANETDDPDMQYYLLQSTKILAKQTRSIIENAKKYGKNPTSSEAREALMDSTKTLKEITDCLTLEVSERKSLQKLLVSAAGAVTAGQKLGEQVKGSSQYNSNESSIVQISKETKSFEKKTDHLHKSLTTVIAEPDSSDANANLLESVQSFVTKANRYVATSDSAVENITDKVKSENLDEATQNMNKALKTLNMHFGEVKLTIENQVSQSKTMVDSISNNLSKLDKVLDDRSIPATPSETAKDATKDILKKTRIQLTSNLDKLQEEFSSSASRSAAQSTGRIIVDETYAGYNAVVNAVLESNDDTVEIRKVLQDSQQLMKWALEILVTGSQVIDTENRELIPSADNILTQMEAISRKVKVRNKDKRTLEDVKDQMSLLLTELDQIEEKNSQMPEQSKEEAVKQLSNSKEMIQDILFNINEAYSEGDMEEATDQLKLLTDATADFNKAIKAFALTESDTSKINRLKEGAKDLMGHVTDLIDKTQSFDGSDEKQKKAAIIVSEAIEDILVDLVSPLEAAVEDEKITNIFKGQSKRVYNAADTLKEEPTLVNCENVSKDVSKLIQCLEILAERETHEDIKAEILLKIAEVDSALELVLASMTPPLDKEKEQALHLAINKLKQKTDAANEMVSQSLAMKQVAEASQKAVDAANASLNKDTGTMSGSKEDTLGNINFKKTVDQVVESINKYNDNPTGAVQRSSLMRSTKRMVTGQKMVPKIVQKTLEHLTDKLEQAREVTKTLDIAASAKMVTDLQLDMQTHLDAAKEGNYDAPYGLNIEDASTELKIARDKVKSCVDQIMDAGQRGNFEAVNSETIPLAESLQEFDKAAKDAAAIASIADQENILTKTNEVYNKAQELIKGAHNCVKNPTNASEFRLMNESAVLTKQALNSTILALPGSKAKSCNELIKTFGDELNDFQTATNEFKVNDLKTGQKRLDTFTNLKKAKIKISETIFKLKDSASKGYAIPTEESTTEMVTLLEGYKNAVQGALAISHASKHAPVLDWARKVMNTSNQLTIDGQMVLKIPGQKLLLDKLGETSSQIIEAMDEVENILHDNTDTITEEHTTRKILITALETLNKMVLGSIRTNKGVIPKDHNESIKQIENNINKLNMKIKEFDYETTTEEELADLIKTANELVSPIEQYIQILGDLSESTKDPTQKKELQNERDELEQLVSDLDMKLKTCHIVKSSNQVISVWDDLAEAKSAIGEGRCMTITNTHVKETDLIKSGIEIHHTVDQMCTAAIQGNSTKLNEAAICLGSKLKQFGVMTKDVASTLSCQIKQKETLDNALSVLESSEKLLHGAYSAIMGLDGETSNELIVAAQSVSKSLNMTMIALPNGPHDAAPELMKCLEEELAEFKTAMQSFDGDALHTKEKASVLSGSLQKATYNLTQNASALKEKALRRDHQGAGVSTGELVNSLEKYRQVAKKAVMGVPDKRQQDMLLDQLQTVLHMSTELTTLAQNVKAQPDNEELVQNLSKVETELNDALTTVIDTFNNATSGCSMASKLMASLMKDNEKAMSSGLAHKMNDNAIKHLAVEGVHKKLMETGADIHSSVDKIVTSAFKGNIYEVNYEAFPLAEKVCDFEATTKDVAATLNSNKDQKNMLKSSNKVIEKIEALLQKAEKVGEDPTNAQLVKELSETSQSLNEALNATLMSTPGKESDTAKEILNSLEAELADFQMAADVLRGKTSAADLAAPANLRAAAVSISDSMSKLVKYASAGDKTTAHISTVQLISAMDQFKSAIQRAAPQIKGKEDQNDLMSKARDIIHQSTQLVTRSKKVLQNPQESHLVDNLNKTEELINWDIKLVEKIITKTEEAQKMSKEASRQLVKQASINLENVTQLEGTDLVDMQKVKEDVIYSTKEIFKLCQDWRKIRRGDREQIVSKMAEHYKDLSNSVRQKLQNDPSDESAREATVAIQILGQNVMALIESLSDENDEEATGEAATNVAASCLGVLTALNAAAKRNQALEGFSRDLTGVATDLETSIMFVSAGILSTEENNTPFSEYRERLLAKATLLVDNVKEILSNVSSKEALISTTETTVMSDTELAEEMKAGSESIGTDLQEAQVCLLSCTKVVVSDLSDLIVQAKIASEQKESIVNVGNQAKSVIANIANLLKTVKTVEDASSRGIRAIETALQAIGQDLAVLQNPESPNTGASPEDLVAASRAVTQTVARAVMAANSGDQDQVAAAANMGRKVMSDLLTTCKAAASGADSDEAKVEVVEEGAQLACQFQELLKQVLHVSSNPAGEDKTELMAVSKGIAQTVTRVARLAEKLKGKEWLDPKEQMEMIAENEMMKAAESIEKAAQRLAELKLKRDIISNIDTEVSVDDMTFDDLILESAQSITKATSSLIKAATTAQKELVAQGKVTVKSEQGAKDSQWAHGLISAANMVASCTQALCEAANTMIQDQTSDGTELVATARQVSKSTAQLVLACQVQTAHGSSSMEGLKHASNAVRKATEELVKAAQGNEKVAQGHEKRPSIKVKKDIFKERIEAEARVLKLEQDLKEAQVLQRELTSKTSFLVSDIRKAREAEGRAMTIAKHLQVAREYMLELNKKQYEGSGLGPSEPADLTRDPDVDVAIAREEQGMRQSLRALKRAGTVRRNTLFGNKRNSDDNVKPSHKL